MQCNFNILVAQMRSQIFFAFEIPSLFSQNSVFDRVWSRRWIIWKDWEKKEKRVLIPENWLGTPTCTRPPPQFTYRNVLWKHIVWLWLTCLFPGLKATVDFSHERVKTKFGRFANWQILINQFKDSAEVISLQIFFDIPHSDIPLFLIFQFCFLCFKKKAKSTFQSFFTEIKVLNTLLSWSC